MNRDNKELSNEKNELKIERDIENKQLNETLEKTNTLLKLSLGEGQKLNVKVISNEQNSKEISTSNLEIKSTDAVTTKSVVTKNDIEDKKSSIVNKVLKSVYRVGEEFFDSMARKFLKEKFKWNFSVYNDGKDAVKSIKEKDYKNFIKKGTDSILYTIKKIPNSTKKIIKNTKNKAIDEVFAWGKE